MWVAATASLLVLASCSGDGQISDATSTTITSAPPTTVSNTSGETKPTTATTATTGPTTTEGQDGEIGETVLVVADDGVYQVSAQGDVTSLLVGPVAYAVDDTQGGLLFQVGRGRSWDDEHRAPTIVWWIPRGASTPRELLVPTPGTDHQLSLHDAYATNDGFAILYVRHEGSTPNVDINDQLRRFDVPARQVTELYSQGAFEQGFGQVSTNGELIAGVLYGQVDSECFIYDLDGQPTDLVPAAAADRPSDDDYVSGCRLSPGGDRLSFFIEQYEDNQLSSTTLHVWDLDADAEAARFVIPGTAGHLRNLDVTATKAVATVVGEDEWQALIFDLDTPGADPVALPIAGEARFVDNPIDIGAAIQLPGFFAGEPNYYRYGDDGLIRVVDGVETQLESQAVTWALDDLAGGVVFRHPGNVSTDVWWLGAGETEPAALPVTGVADASLVDGRPTLLVNSADPERELCPDHDFGEPVLMHDIPSGDQTFLFCEDEGPDGGRRSTSLGNGLLASVEWAMSTDKRIVFMDLSGQEVAVGTNPVPEPCWPCTLDAQISDDGALLAYSLWPTAFWNVPVVDGDHESAYATWKATAETVPVEVAVLDLESGVELWHMTLDPGVRLVDFDGRYLVTGPSYSVDIGPSGSAIYDTWGLREPVEVGGAVALIRQEPTPPTAPELVLGYNGLGAVSFGDPVADVMAVLEGRFGAPSHDDVYESPFDIPSGWHGDDRGPEACHVAAHGNICFDYLRFAWWESAGLWVLFSDIEANPGAAPDEDGYWVQVPPSFQGYGYGGHERAVLYTTHGITVGSTTEDLRSLGPIVSFNWTPCGSQVEFTISDPGRAGKSIIHGLLNDEDFEAFEETGIPDESARVLSLNAGQHDSC